MEESYTEMKGEIKTGVEKIKMLLLKNVFLCA